MVFSSTGMLDNTMAIQRRLDKVYDYQNQFGQKIMETIRMKMKKEIQTLLLKYLILTLKAFLVILAAYLFLKRSQAGEDAFIFFRYVDNFVNGHGLVFNIGERVEGFTAPLWVFLLSFLRIFLPYELRSISIVLGIILSTLSIALILLFDGKEKVFFPIGVLLLITNSAFRDFATSGFETSLTYLLLTVLALLIKKTGYGKIQYQRDLLLRYWF